MSFYPPNMVLRPLVGWPGPATAKRRRSPFEASFSTTLDQLGRELRHLGGGRPAPSVLQLALREQDFRISDGMPRVNSRPAHPGVILSIETQTPVSFPCDTFDHWHDNVRAITLTLESLRRIDRYGVTRNGEQYTGWLAIEQTGSLTSPREAAEVLANAAGMVDVVFDMSSANVTRLYRSAVKAAHPDRNGGDATLWDTVERAAKFLRGTGYLK